MAVLNNGSSIFALFGVVKRGIRLKWCREHADWDEDRKYVIWADEARFQLFLIIIDGN